MTIAVQRLEERLERGDIVTFQPCPFALPGDDDLAFLRQQQLSGAGHKNISYNPTDGAVSGFARHSPEQTERLQRLLGHFSRQVTDWLATLLPGYAQTWQPDRASLRTEEEATRKLRLNARNDLLHFDAFPSRPTRGHRILRCYVNIHPTDDRVWLTSETFATVLAKYGSKVRLPGQDSNSWMRRLGHGIIRLVQPNILARTEYDDFMLRLHHFLKTNDKFQEQSSRKLWHFKPGTAWLLFSDTISHAELRGQHALEHSYFVSPHTLVLPAESPAALLAQMNDANPASRAA
jgi:hypothetical protein